MAVETGDSEFIKRLTGFGLSEKEAQLYLHLLKYGPKSTSLLAQSLKTIGKTFIERSSVSSTRA